MGETCVLPAGVSVKHRFPQRNRQLHLGQQGQQRQELQGHHSKKRKKLPSQALKQPRPKRMIVLTSWHSCFLFGLFCVGGECSKSKTYYQAVFLWWGLSADPQKKKKQNMYIRYIYNYNIHTLALLLLLKIDHIPHLSHGNFSWVLSC